MRIRVMMLAIAGALLASCDSTEHMRDESQPASIVEQGRATPEMPPPAPAGKVAGLTANAPGFAGDGAAGGGVQLPSARDSAPPSMIIRSGNATIEVDSLEAAVTATQALARQLGGLIAGTSMNTGRNQVRSATLELKVPADRWDALRSGLEPLGRVENVSENAMDVGEEYVDVSARMTNARRLETRLIELLERRTGKLEDVLAVERELARVREEIERYEGRLRWLRAHAALSSMTVMLHEPMPVVGAPGENIIGSAFRDAWRNFVRFIAALIAASGVLIPLGAAAVVLLLIARRLGWVGTRASARGNGQSRGGRGEAEPPPRSDSTTG